ncbi:helix-turn-helix transcriptional regulator [Yinghuangia seranimata]|uniref:helix-turn-helix transcriptional regulator n=1 Tax=Yinghuangia seranimata TaxID=408067 RepID=UPI00248D1BB6|nr:helix-turn-helix transcriptional regulator [Yinghuangia seranimata]MDI2128250.1 helix-turn-helix transcriptional regulator [Yinghuangia seranimata]
MDGRAELGAFLRSRRARLKPEEAGLDTYGDRRRVPGLRREELARLAGVSVDYYVRFEQGRTDSVSDAVVDAVATALRLTDAERAHLHNLARAIGRRPATPSTAAQTPTPGQLRLLAAMSDVPAYLVGRRTDILAWNPLYAELIGPLDTMPPERRNTAWLVFLDADVRARYVNWDVKARNVVAYLRRDLGRHPDDPAFTALIDELTDASPEFRKLWAEQQVADRTGGDYHMRHPAAGELHLSFESFTSTADPDTSLITYTAEPGSPTETALRRLAAQP